MILHRLAIDEYVVQITTDPPLDAWEASFDGGTTFVDGVKDVVTGYWSWLLAGADAAAVPPAVGPEVAVISGNLTPLVRDVDNPLIIVRNAPVIRYRT